MRKTEKYICVFAVVAGFVASYVIGYRYGHDEKDNTIKVSEETSDSQYSTGNTANQATDVAVESRVLKSDATLVMEINHEESDIAFETIEMNIPIELIGLTRDDVVDYVKNNGDFFTDDDEELINIMLMSFSENQIVLRKNVREGQVIIYPKGESEEYNYFIGFKDNKVVVFKKDKSTVFIETGITYDMVDKDTRSDIEEGIWIENITTLYRYLESITS